MKVKVAETAGFCFGVKRAVDKVYQLIEEDTHPIYTLGPIIHNEEVVTDLAAKGVQVIEEKDLPSLTEGTVVIRSHGVGKAIYQELKENYYKFPAQLPPLTWLDDSVPASPKEVFVERQGDELRLSWQKPEGETRDLTYTVYYSLADSVDTSLASSILATNIPSGE